MIFESRKRLGRVAKSSCYIFLLLALVTALFPIVWTLLTSIKFRVDALAIPPKWIGFQPTLDNYRKVLRASEFRKAVRVSIEVTLGSTTLAVSGGVLLAYSLVRLDPPGKRIILAVLMLAQVIPVVVLVTPLYAIATQFGLYDNVAFVIVIISALILPFATWVMIAFLRGIPLDLEEAAAVDGASRMRIIWFVVLPLLSPGVATCAIFASIGAWSAFLVPSVIGESDARTLPVVIAGYVSARTVDWGPLAAAASLTLIPVILFTIAAQRLLVSGLTVGGVRG